MPVGSFGQQSDPWGFELSGKRSDRNAGSRRPVKDPLEVQGSTGIYIHSTADDPGNHSGHGVDGLFFFAGSSLWNVDFALGHTVFCVPYILMEVKARLVGMDPSLEEAARDLGAGPGRAFWDITLPLIMPAVISGSLLAFAMSMDDVVISIFINGPRLSTLPIKVYTQLKTGVTPEINALCTILLAATLVIFIVYSLITKKKK